MAAPEFDVAEILHCEEEMREVQPIAVRMRVKIMEREKIERLSLFVFSVWQFSQ